MSTAGWKKRVCKGGHVDPPRYKGGACKECVKLKSNARYLKKKPEMIEAVTARAKLKPEQRRDEQRAYNLGVSVSEVRRVLDDFDGTCEACSRELTHATLCIDHSHETGKVRGILCRFCNALEGILRKQADRVLLVKAYLAKKECK